MDGKTLTSADVSKIASLESREVLLSKLAGAMTATMSQALYAFTALPAKMAQLGEALRQKAEADPSILRGGAGTPEPVAAEPVSAEPVAEGAEAENAPEAEAVAVADEAPATEDAVAATEDSEVATPTTPEEAVSETETETEA